MAKGLSIREVCEVTTDAMTTIEGWKTRTGRPFVLRFKTIISPAPECIELVSWEVPFEEMVISGVDTFPAWLSKHGRSGDNPSASHNLREWMLFCDDITQIVSEFETNYLKELPF